MTTLRENFDGDGLHPDLDWWNEPRRIECIPGVGLRVETQANTDFWQRTHYGFAADNGHVLGARLSVNFTLSTHVRFHPVHQYDQAGLLVRLSPTCWLKTSVEHEPDGPDRLGVVVTNAGWSDWSTQDAPASLRDVHLRIRRSTGDYFVDASFDGAAWTQLRIARLHEDVAGATPLAGIYACSPRGQGFAAEFSFLALEVGR